MTRDDDALLVAIGRTLKGVVAKTDARIVALEQRVQALERQADLEKRLTALEARSDSSERPRLRAAGGA